MQATALRLKAAGHPEIAGGRRAGARLGRPRPAAATGESAAAGPVDTAALRQRQHRQHLDAPQGGFSPRFCLRGRARGGAEWRRLKKASRWPSRSDNGKLFGFGDPQDLDAEMQGRFATILPPKEPDAATQAIAKALLQIKIQKAKPGKTSRPSRSGQ